MSARTLEVDTLSCERDLRELFSGLSFRLEPGKVLQVAGPNGSGKTSLLRILAGLLPAAEGDVRYDGASIFSGQGREQWRQNTLYIGHQPAVKAMLTPEENLAWLCALKQPVSRKAIWSALEQVGLRGFEDVPSRNLSAGQHRRVALARLYLQPLPVWILDEPFTAIDKSGVAGLEQHVLAHADAGGSVILTTHHSLEHLPQVQVLDLREGC
ncbi:MAG: cytochrome c biogenesis heme-transporting ATPase CcmA [Halopseudomonas yangmingensis]|uniref:Heme exporter protein A n=1 Tax=Halopseudomonas yangmingensis TaxID=1720063 RepID=A0A1I4NF10_9GAMM|nr:cytochrome c biogenesis heme-transporting ATPase CcmA [Halopseudomonas yangmingensis]SFM13976.1 heme exporter protein A [Halopseudomonas yangmingensis]